MKNFILLLIFSSAAFSQQSCLTGSIPYPGSVTIKVNGQVSHGLCVNPVTGLVSVAGTSALNVSTFTAWGDSLTGGNEDSGGVTYPGVLSANMGHIVQNKGVGGNTSAQVLTRFLAAPTTWGNFTIIESGRNDASTCSTTVLPNIAAMVSRLTGQYLVLSILNGEGEGIGTGGYANVTGCNSQMAAIYGTHYFDIRAALVAQYNPANGADVLDHTNDIPPFSLRALDANGTLTSAISSTSTCTFTVSNAGVGGSGQILSVDSEYIYVTSATSGSVTSCTRGYGGTTAATHSSGASYLGTDFLHLSGTGYIDWAVDIQPSVVANSGVLPTVLQSANQSAQSSYVNNAPSSSTSTSNTSPPFVIGGTYYTSNYGGKSTTTQWTCTTGPFNAVTCSPAASPVGDSAYWIFDATLQANSITDVANSFLLNQGGLNFGSNPLGWNAGPLFYSSAVDTGMSRLAAKSIAIGNGTSSDVTGTTHQACLAMKDTVTTTLYYITITGGSLVSSTTKPAACN